MTQLRWESWGEAVRHLTRNTAFPECRGKLRWEEMLPLHIINRFRDGSSLGFSGIEVQVAGAIIPIADVYDRPLGKILAIMRRYWRP